LSHWTALAGRATLCSHFPDSFSRAWRWCLVLGLFWVAGCAQPVKSGSSMVDEVFWSGRLAMQVEDQASQSLSVLFELRGSALKGGLVLISPLGNRLAQADWNDGYAQLVTGPQEVRVSESVDNLLYEATGARIPVAALFSWLQGTQSATPGWQADLSDIAEGRLTARRTDPAPPVTLRIVLNQ
jgi:outer membrane lipoprotein LolB